MMKDLVASIILIVSLVALFAALPRIEKYFLDPDHHGEHSNETHR